MINSILSRSPLWMVATWVALAALMFPSVGWAQNRGIIDGSVAPPANNVEVSGNDTGAINRAIRIADGQRPVWVPKGRYKIDKIIRLSSNTRLVMHRDAVLVRDPGYRRDMMGTFARNFDITGVHIEGGRFESDSNTGGVIRAWGTDWVITNVHIRNFRGIAVELKGNGHSVTRSTFEGPKRRTGETDFDGTAALHIYGGDGIRVNRCIVESGDDGIPIQPNGVAPIIPTRDCVVENCTIRSFEGAAVVVGASRAGGEVSDITFRNISGLVHGATGRKNGGSLATITNTGPRQEAFPTRSGVRDILYENVWITATGSQANAETGFAIRTDNGNWVENVRVIDCFFGPASTIDGRGIAIDQSGDAARNHRDIILRNSFFLGSERGIVRRPEGNIENTDNAFSPGVRFPKK